MTLAPRPAHLNPELALFIHSAPLAGEVARLIDRTILPSVSYGVQLATPAERAPLRSIGASVSPLVWPCEEGTASGTYMRTYTLDPEAGFYRNALTGLFLLLPVDAQ